MKNKILIILNEFPPHTSPTSIAVKPVIDNMKNLYDIICLASGPYTDQQIIDNTIKVYYVKDLFQLVKTISNTKLHSIIHIFFRIRLRIMQILTIPLYPVTRPLFQKKLEKTALNICKNERIDCVISVCFPQETISAGNYVKKKCTNLKFVAYIIDAFSGGTLPKYLPSKFSRKRKIKYEKRLLANTDLVVAMECSAEFYRKNMFKNNFCFLNPAFLHKHTDLSITTSSAFRFLDKNKINILYTGYLYFPDRDPSFIIHLVSALKLNNICLTFVGNINNDIDKVFSREKEDFFGELKCLPFVPHKDLKYLLSEADFFLNMGVSNANAISGKIFEYMAFGKPIITTYFDENDASLQYLNKYPLSICVNQNTESINSAAAKLKEFIKDVKTKTVPYKFVEETFYSSTAHAFVEKIDKVLKENDVNENRNYL